MPFQTPKETALPAVLPYHDVKLLGVVQNKLVVGLRREVFIKVAWRNDQQRSM